MGTAKSAEISTEYQNNNKIATGLEITAEKEREA